jgi:outer membrane protein with beta-barrel domain
MRLRVLALAFLLLSPGPAAAEWQFKPFAGITFGGGTRFVDIEKAAGKPNPVFGVTGLLLGGVLGVEGDLARAPGFFESGGQRLLQDSRVTTLTGNVVVAVPRRMAEYSLRPYLVAGMGLMHVNIDGRLGALTVSSTLPAIDFGGGATGFLTDRVGLSWEVRHFQSIGEGKIRGLSVSGGEQLSFWRATMAVTFRYGK